jgi:hypothetical protein
MSLTANRKRNIIRPEPSLARQLTVATGVTIYEGANVSLDGSGDAIVGVSGTKCVGISKDYGEAGDTVTVEILQVERITFATSADKVGEPIYVLTDDTYTLTPNASKLGYIVSYIDASTVDVHVTPDYPFATS